MLRIVFMGTPEFAVESLDILVKKGYDVVGVVTAPDNPAGRGLKPQPSPVKEYAIARGLKILQPLKLKDPDFIEELRSLRTNLQVVVAFRMLPEIIWNMPEYGTFNLHASLLPQYRGAAPLNWAIINGETETGVTTFFLKQEIDTGQVIFQEKTPIGPDETVGELHDRLKITGANLVLKTVRAIESGNVPSIDQDHLVKPGIILRTAPRIFKEDCRIDWSKNISDIYNFIRGLSPYPGAFTSLIAHDGIDHSIKVFRTNKIIKAVDRPPGSIETDGTTFLEVTVPGGKLVIIEIQLAGKRRMEISEFLRGFRIDNSW